MKRKADDPTRVPPALQKPAATASHSVAANIYFASDWLKDRKKPATWEEIAEFLNVQHLEPDQRSELRRRLTSNNPLVEFDPKGLDGKGAYSYKAKIKVFSEEDLLAYLQKKETCEGTRVKDLKEGWDKAPQVVEHLAKRKKVLVTLNKKDGSAALVWRNDPSLEHSIEEDFKRSWDAQKLPTTKDDLRKALIADGLTPTSQVKKPTANLKKDKKKVARRGGKTMNTHMGSLLKDFSHLRK